MGMNISEMLAKNARMYPDDTALIELKPGAGARREISWRQFDDRVNRLANALTGRGVKKGDRVIHWMSTLSAGWRPISALSGRGHGRYRLTSVSPLTILSTVPILPGRRL